MNLRGHHLLCLLGFQGHGYSVKFIEKMKELAPLYKNDKRDILIYINPDTDEICKSCPAMTNKNCTTYDFFDKQIRKLDKRVLTVLELEEGKTYSKSIIFERIRNNVNPEDLETICKGCKWLRYGVCKEAIEKMKKLKG